MPRDEWAEITAGAAAEPESELEELRRQRDQARDNGDYDTFFQLQEQIAIVLMEQDQPYVWQPAGTTPQVCYHCRTQLHDDGAGHCVNCGAPI